MLPEGNINCRGWTNRDSSLVQGQHLFSYTDFLQPQLHWQQCRHQRLILRVRVILQGNLIEYYPAHEMRLPKWRQRVILLARAILQGIAEFYPARDMLSTNEISNIVYEY